MNKVITTIFVLSLIFFGFVNEAFATGVWDNNVILDGVNGNGSWDTGDEVRVKKSPGGNSGCTIVKFRPGYGNIPSNGDGIAARNRIYAAALVAYASQKPVSIWVYDTMNCYGLMLVLGDAF